MKQQLHTLRDVAAMLGVAPHQVTYAIASGKTPEPLRLSGRRHFSQADIEQLRIIFSRPAKRGRRTDARK